jgi:large-conductance mechanosensitive channel
MINLHILIEQFVNSCQYLYINFLENIQILLILIIDFLKSNLAGFIKFLFDKSIIQTGIGIIIATQISKLTNLFVESIINPIVNRVSLGTVDNINQWELSIFDITLKIGLIISGVINFLSITVIVYYIWKFSLHSNFEFINNLLEETKDSVKSKVIINVNSNN